MFRQQSSSRVRSYHPLLEALEARALPSFLPAVVYSVGGYPLAPAVGDFDGDGIPDVAVTNRDGTVDIGLGNGDGTFRRGGSFPAGVAPTGVTVADFNGDGNLDLAVTDYGTSSGTVGVSVLLGNGDGTFQAPVFYPLAGVGRPEDIAAADFNNDGKLDLAVANLDGAPLSVLLGNGNGTFQSPVNYGTVSFAASLAVADLKGDRHMDVVVANPFSNTLTVYYGDGTGAFPTIQGFSVSDPNGVAIGDVNGDGIPDLVATDGSANQVAVLRGNGDDTFQSPTGYSVGAGRDPNVIVLADFNGDGILDAATSNLFTNDVSVLLGNGDGSFQSGLTYSARGTDPERLAAADLNGDGFPDLGTANYESGTCSVLINAADWGGLSRAARQGSLRPGRDPSISGLLLPGGSMSAVALGQDPQGFPQPVSAVTGRPQQSVPQGPRVVDSGGSTEAESPSMPTSVAALRHSSGAVLREWLDPAVEVLALNVLS